MNSKSSKTGNTMLGVGILGALPAGLGSIFLGNVEAGIVVTLFAVALIWFGMKANQEAEDRDSAWKNLDKWPND